MADDQRTGEHQGETGGTADALSGAAARTAAFLRAIRDPAAPVPGLTWNIAETAVHLLGELQDYTSLVTGERDVSGYFNPEAGEQTPAQRGADANARALDQIAERDLPTLAGLITDEASRFIRASAQCRADARFLTSNGIAMSVPVMTAALLGEQVIHGLDIARASGTHWPISRHDALAVIDGVMAMVPDYIDRQRAAGKHVTYELRFRGGPTYWLRIDDGSAALGKPGGRADCWISADPVAFLLVGYGRVGQWGQILRGKLVAGGRAPWHGFAFGALITNP